VIVTSGVPVHLRLAGISARRRCSRTETAAFTDGKIDRPGGARREWDGDNFPALSGDHERAVAALNAQGLDIGTSGFGDP
jgi:hypothetical protein